MLGAGYYLDPPRQKERMRGRGCGKRNPFSKLRIQPVSDGIRPVLAVSRKSPPEKK